MGTKSEGKAVGSEDMTRGGEMESVRTNQKGGWGMNGRVHRRYALRPLGQWLALEWLCW